MAGKRKNNEKKDVFTSVMTVQTILGCILIIAMLISFRGNGWFFSVMTESYAEYMQSDFTLQDMSDVFQKFKSDYRADSEKNNDAVAENDINNEFAPTGGKDIEFSSLEALEGISFEDIQTGIVMQYPLKNYRITSEFGYRIGPITNVPGVHTGLDMAADYGSNVYAAADGMVADAGWDNSYGNYVKILHQNNTVSIYAHCSRLCVRNGDSVVQGEKIAEVGSTGASTGNHLHFEVRKDNIRINPVYLLDEK